MKLTFCIYFKEMWFDTKLKLDTTMCVSYIGGKRSQLCVSSFSDKNDMIPFQNNYTYPPLLPKLTTIKEISTAKCHVVRYFILVVARNTRVKYLRFIKTMKSFLNILLVLVKFLPSFVLTLPIYGCISR